MIPQKKDNEKFTYSDYLTWPDDERWEIIDGEAWDMSPAPSTEHQSISMFFSTEISTFLKDKSCRIFAAPFDIRLSEPGDIGEEEIVSVVQPDISVICDSDKIDKKGCRGAPDLIIEILSPSTAYKDETEKLMLYEKHSVKEYWIVNPDAEYIMIYRYNGKDFDKPEYLKGEDVIRSLAIEGLEISLTDVFKN